MSDDKGLRFSRLSLLITSRFCHPYLLSLSMCGKSEKCALLCDDGQEKCTLQYIMTTNFIHELEQQELIQKLIDAGYGEMVNAFLDNEKQVYTKKGRLNKSGACRVLGWKNKQLEETLEACRKLLATDLRSN